MLFELRNSTPEVSPSWREVRDLYLEGRTRLAWSTALERRSSPSLETANDYVLNAEVARACSAYHTCFAIVRKGLSVFPDDPVLQLHQARSLLSRGRHTTGIEFLRARESTLGKTHRALWGTQLANVYGNAGFAASCRRWLEAVRDDKEINSPLSLYTMSCASEGMQDWSAAIRYARGCVGAAPDWSRARAHLAHCLLSRGRIEEAEQVLEDAQRRGHEESTVDVSAAMLALSLGRFDQARTRLEQVLTDWTEGEFSNWARRVLYILLVEIGENDAAKAVAGGREGQFGWPSVPAQCEKRHRFIPLPLIAQNKNQCVPTSAAMVAYPQGRRLDPDRLFREMRGRDGTALWRMRAWMEDHGFRVVPVRLEKEGVVELLDRDVPLIGTIEGAFNSHVEVVCGYNDDMQVLYVRDPAHWAPLLWPWDLALSRYAMHKGLFAIVDVANTDAIAVAKEWRSDECAALLDLSQATAEGDRSAAEAAFARVSDDSTAAFLRDCHAVNVVISPIRFHERMRAVAEDDDSDLVARLRAVMTLGAEEACRVIPSLLDRENGLQVSSGMCRYFELLECVAHGRWEEARSLIDRLLLTGGGVAAFWELKSDVLAELGQHDASAEALERAIELEPLRMSLREKSLNRSATRLTFAEYLDEIDALLLEDPDDKRLMLGRVAALQEGLDGKAFEKASREAIRWFPRDPSGYQGLMTWYEIQGRHDLASLVQEEAHRLLPDTFRPVDDSAEPTEPSDAPEVAETPSDGGQVPEGENLPDDKNSLLNLVWSIEDPRRVAARLRALELEAEGQLLWHERARLLANRLLIGETKDEDPEDAKALLPATPSGPAHWFASVLCDILSRFEPRAGVAREVGEWLCRVVPNIRDYPELWFQYVVLLEQATEIERALGELRQLLEAHPASSSALYRMGVVKYGQQDFHASQRYLEQALRIHPGLSGALEALRNVHQVLNADTSILDCTRRLRRKWPYATDYVRDEVLAVAAGESVSAALAILDACESDFPGRRISVLRARVFMATNRFEEASEILAGVNVTAADGDGLFEEWLQARMDLALHRNDVASLLDLCEQGLIRWPDSTRLKEIQAEYLSPTDPDRSRSLLLDVLHKGEPQPQTAWLYLGLGDSTRSPDAVATAAIQSSPEARRESLVDLFAGALAHPETVHWIQPFLEWALKEFPKLDTVRWRLAMHYDMSGQTMKAIRLAEELHERNPESLEALRTLGRCWIDRNPRKALPYLKSVCRQDRSVDHLFDLARCYQIAGDLGKSMGIHWEILKQNPYSSSSWTALYLASESQVRLWPYLQPMLERGHGVEDEYFLVAAVRIALDRRETLVPAWFSLAAQRLLLLRTHPGFRDERSRLKRAVLAWLSVRPIDAQGLEGLPRHPLLSLVARFYWPRQAWVPTESP